MINSHIQCQSVRGLFIARFQPIHRGHIEVIREILQRVDELLVVIAAAQISHTLKNPLTAGERLEMVRNALIEAKIPMHRVWILPAQDIFDNALWVTHLKRLLPPFDVMFSNNPFTINLFKEAGLKTERTGVYEREKYSATAIRQAIIDQEPIDQNVYPSTIELLNQWKIRERLLSIVITDEPEQSKSETAGTELTKGH
ncbi:MAG: nicotinamide-nucleotide adenylyltransferase [Methanobacteriota archaeon]|nr:MAG: nicotinamide-nucleotide adenylyltransferase [Euryarchaeota archaeon]